MPLVLVAAPRTDHFQQDAGLNYSTEVAQRTTPNCSRPQPATDNYVRFTTANIKLTIAAPHAPQSVGLAVKVLYIAW